jgi:hypothetical protein
MSEKYLQVTMPNGDKYNVPALFIALHQAMQLESEFTRVYNEVAYALEHPDSLFEWAANNMNWPDVEEVAVLAGHHPDMTLKDYQEGWVNGDKRLVEE